MGRYRHSLIMYAITFAFATSLATASAPAFAQTRVRIEIDVLEPSVALAQLASGQEHAVLGASRVILAAFRHDTIDTVRSITRVGNYDRYTAAQRQTLLDGVERIAKGDIPGSEAVLREATSEAIFILRTIGLDPAIKAPEAREIPRRVLRIYEESSRLASRSAAAKALGHLLRHSGNPQESRVIIDVLVEAASSRGRVAPLTALRSLQSACEAGMPAIRRMHRENLARNQEVAAIIYNLAQRGFPMARQTLGPPCNSQGG